MQTHFRLIFVNVLLLQCFLTTVFAASILEHLISWSLTDDSTGVKERNENIVSQNQQNCACNGPSCMCCVDFNFTFVDLGGPGCVQLKYLSQDEGIAINVSYGDSLLHSNLVKGSNPEPTCMNLFLNLTQICARFTDLYPTDDGLRGCLKLEPSILEEVQTQFNIGCFTMGPEGMRLDPVPVTETSTTISPLTETTEPSEEPNEETNAEDLLAVVNKSAQESLAFFGNLLGFNFGQPKPSEPQAVEQTAPEEAVTVESRKFTGSSQNSRTFPRPELNAIV